MPLCLFTCHSVCLHATMSVYMPKWSWNVSLHAIVMFTCYWMKWWKLSIPPEKMLTLFQWHCPELLTALSERGLWAQLTCTYFEVFLNYAKRAAFEVCKLVSFLDLDTLCFYICLLFYSLVLSSHACCAFEVNLLFSNYAQIFFCTQAKNTLSVTAKMAELVKWM